MAPTTPLKIAGNASTAFSESILRVSSINQSINQNKYISMPNKKIQ